MIILLVCLLVLYNAWLVTYLLWEKRQGEKLPEANSPPQKRRAADTSDIMGKSLFSMKEKVPTPATSLPQAATYGESEEIREEDVTFADEMPDGLSEEDTEEAEEIPPARIPDDKLDEVFADVRMEDVPVEYDGEGPDRKARIGYATGASFEEIERAVRTAKNPQASEEDRQHAGMVFTRMEGNELFDKLVESSSSIGKKITGLMDRYLNKPIIPKGGSNEVREVQPQGIPVIPDSVEGFNIRDFV